MLWWSDWITTPGQSSSFAVQGLVLVQRDVVGVLGRGDLFFPGLGHILTWFSDFADGGIVCLCHRLSSASKEEEGSWHSVLL